MAIYYSGPSGIMQGRGFAPHPSSFLFPDEKKRTKEKSCQN